MRHIVSILVYSALLHSVIASGADAALNPLNPLLKKTVVSCGACHGANGRSVSPIFPNLAAQLAPYIELQLKAFKDQSRADPDAQAYMWGMASQLNDGMISELAAYYAAQPPAPGRGGSSNLISQGKQVFEGGVPAHNIPAYASCHGDHGQGLDAFPRLAGQHAPYLLKQLLVIQNALRTSPVMHGVIKDLTKDQILAVVAYLESL